MCFFTQKMPGKKEDFSEGKKKQNKHISKQAKNASFFNPIVTRLWRHMPVVGNYFKVCYLSLYCRTRVIFFCVAFV